MSFQQGLSGLNATNKNLEIIGNNIANSNTFGAKVSRAEFADVYAMSLNGAGTNNIGIGVNLQAPRDDLPQPATGLDQSLMPLPDRHRVLAAILRELGLVLEAFAVDGFSGAKMDWQQRHAW